MDFPRKRFERVGATVAELDKMEHDFLASVEAAQRSLVDRLAPLPDAAIAQLLDEHREREQAAEAPAASQPAAPAAASSSSSSSTPAKAAADSTQSSS